MDLARLIATVRQVRISLQAFGFHMIESQNLEQALVGAHVVEIKDTKLAICSMAHGRQSENGSKQEPAYKSQTRRFTRHS